MLEDEGTLKTKEGMRSAAQESNLIIKWFKENEAAAIIVGNFANISQTSERKIDEHEYLRIGFNNPNNNGFPPWGSNESLALSLMSIYRSAVASSHTDLSYFSNWRFIADFFPRKQLSSWASSS